jgi:hypothetical protein
LLLFEKHKQFWYQNKKRINTFKIIGLSILILDWKESSKDLFPQLWKMSQIVTLKSNFFSISILDSCVSKSLLVSWRTSFRDFIVIRYGNHVWTKRRKEITFILKSRKIYFNRSQICGSFIWLRKLNFGINKFFIDCHLFRL